MMDDVKVPEKPRFVADAMKYVVSEVVNYEQSGPRPPRIGREFIRCDLVKEYVNAAGNKPKDRPIRYFRTRE